MVDAVENIKPICEVEKVGVAGTIYDVPGIVARDRQQTLDRRLSSLVRRALVGLKIFLLLNVTA